ncbi:MAG: accessory gene regulator B family protein [Bacillota bacterium]
MFNLEKTSHKIVTILLKNSDADELTKARAEYGLSLLLGILIELFFCLSIAWFLNLFLEALLLMSFSLIFRVFAGGAHCSSYDRCLIFTIFFYIFLSYLANYICLILPADLLYSFSLLFLVIILYISKNKSPVINKVLFIDGVILLSFWLLNSKADYIFIINLGILLQSLMGTETGSNIVKAIDTTMEKIGI